VSDLAVVVDEGLLVARPVRHGSAGVEVEGLVGCHLDLVEGAVLVPAAEGVRGFVRGATVRFGTDGRGSSGEVDFP
jgi:hypothetical protein